jgi:4,5-dihydroxyphthalate decarboxylase
MTIDVQGGDYEHVLALSEGRAGDEFAYRKVGLAPLSKTVLSGAPFDAAEYSVANHIMLHAKGEKRWGAIPIFPSRAFRNVSVFVAKDSPLTEVARLKGKRVAISEFAMTTAIWGRGHMHDDFGLDWRDVDWLIGSNPRFPMPAGVRATETDANLEDLVASGEVDAFMGGKPKDAQRPPAERRLRPLVADSEGVERDYFARTGLFPIMHCVVLHPRVLTGDGMPERLFDAYAAAKREALGRRLSAGFLPFAERGWDRFGGQGAEAVQYGLTDLNRRNIQTLARYLREQGFIDRESAIDDLFEPGAAGWTDN